MKLELPLKLETPLKLGLLLVLERDVSLEIGVSMKLKVSLKLEEPLAVGVPFKLENSMYIYSAFSFRVIVCLDGCITQTPEPRGDRPRPKCGCFLILLFISPKNEFL